MCLRHSDVDSTHGVRLATGSLERYLLYLPHLGLLQQVLRLLLYKLHRDGRLQRVNMDTRESEPASIPMWK